VRLYFDTSVLVAVAVAHHPHHTAAMAAYRQMLSGKHTGVVSAHGLAETFSTLTRLPLSPMIHPTEAHRYIAESIVRHCEIVSLNGDDYLAMLESAARADLRGGIVYDALQLHCAEKARCDRIYTFNLTDFLRLAPHLENRILRP
jgi:predicted nucleic acid-binding protein